MAMTKRERDERDFLRLWRALPAGRRARVLEVIERVATAVSPQPRQPLTGREKRP